MVMLTCRDQQAAAYKGSRKINRPATHPIHFVADSPDKIIAALHFANAVPPQTLLIFAPVLPRKPHRRNCVKLTQFLLSPCGSIGEITLGIFQRLFQKFLQLIRIIIHPMVGLRKFNIVVWNVVQNVRSH